MSEVDIVDQVDERLVEDSVNFINMKVAESVFKGSLEIGEYLLVNFFGNDIQLAASQNPLKATSYNALRRRPDLGVSRSTLSRMVRIAAQERFFKSRKTAVGFVVLQRQRVSYPYPAKIEALLIPEERNFFSRP